MTEELEYIIEEAYQAWKLLDHELAAQLFIKASKIESELSKKRPKHALPNQAFNHEIRAGLCLFEAGKVSDARGILFKALEFDWKGERLWGDRHVTEIALTYLLLDLAELGNKKEFGKLFDLGIQKGEQLQYPFPTIISNQKKLITACIGLSDRKRCRIVVEKVADSSIKKDKELKLLKLQAEKYISGFWFLNFESLWDRFLRDKLYKEK